jgi:hypothetical protein
VTKGETRRQAVAMPSPEKRRVGPAWLGYALAGLAVSRLGATPSDVVWLRPAWPASAPDTREKAEDADDTPPESR